MRNVNKRMLFISFDIQGEHKHSKDIDVSEFYMDNGKLYIDVNKLIEIRLTEEEKFNTVIHLGKVCIKGFLIGIRLSYFSTEDEYQKIIIDEKESEIILNSSTNQISFNCISIMVQMNKEEKESYSKLLENVKMLEIVNES